MVYGAAWCGYSTVTGEKQVGSNPIQTANKLKRIIELLPCHGRDPGSNPGYPASKNKFRVLVQWLACVKHLMNYSQLNWAGMFQGMAILPCKESVEGSIPFWSTINTGQLKGKRLVSKTGMDRVRSPSLVQSKPKTIVRIDI